MQQSKAYVIKNATRNLKATIAARKAEYIAYRYGAMPSPHAGANARKAPMANVGARANG